MISFQFPTDPERAQARWHWTLLRFIFGAALALALPCDLGAQTVMTLPSAKVKSCAGTVTVVPKSGATSAAYVGATLLPGDKLQVGANGTTELDLPGAGAARMEADSEVKLPEANGTTPPKESLEMLKGRLFLNIDAKKLKQQGNREFLLKTPATVLAVKGTRFFAFSSAKGDTVGVHEGMVQAFEPLSKQTRQLKAGTAVEASPNKLSAPRALRPAEDACGFIYPGAPVPGWVVPIGDGDRFLTIGFIQTGNGDRYYLRQAVRNRGKVCDELWKESRDGKRELVFQSDVKILNLGQILAGPEDTIYVTSVGLGDARAGLYKVVEGAPRLVSKESVWMSQLDPQEQEAGMAVSFGRKTDGTIDPQDLFFCNSFKGIYRTNLTSPTKASPPVLAYPVGKTIGFTMVGTNDVYVTQDGHLQTDPEKPLVFIVHSKYPQYWSAPTYIAVLPIVASETGIVTMGVWPINEKPKPKP